MKAVLALVLFVPATLAAQQSPEQQAREERARMDPAGLTKYRDQNAALAPAPGEPRIVFMGDSITENWRNMAPEFFQRGHVGRGISGQTTMQMVVRFRQDVIDLRPRIVHIMAGTNDLAGNTGIETDADIQNDIRSMVELAQAHGIRVILASMPPAADFPWHKGLNPGPRIVRLNAWLKDYAAKSGSVYADYWSALHDGNAFRADLALDGVHPNKAGYAVMAPIAEAAIRKALALRSVGTAIVCSRAGTC
ncbi:MAG TPA: SGNH/GDSL hydrolase family protein [Allosphingosinicella sp.]|nr:SGNH/GDSL hydrolase family protein [Allosphingosinicella sp.]